MTVYIAHFLDFEGVGIYGLITAATTMAPSILGFGIMANISRFAVTEPKYIIADALKQYGKFILIVYGIIGMITYLICHYTGNHKMIFISFALIFFEQMNSDFYTLFLNLSKPLHANLLHFLRAAGWAIIYMLLAYIFPDLQSIETILIFWLITSMITCYLFYHYFDFSTENQFNKIPILSKKFISYTYMNLKSSWMLYLNMVVTTLSQYGDRYIISASLGLKYTGIYIFFWQISSAIANLVFTGIIQLYRPKIVKAFINKELNYGLLVKKCLFYTFLTCTFFALSASLVLYYMDYFLPFLNKPEIKNYLYIGWIIFTGLVIHMLGEVLNIVYYSKHLDRKLFYLNTKILFISFINSLVWILLFGITGAAIGFLSYGIIQLFLKYKDIKNNNFIL